MASIYMRNYIRKDVIVDGVTYTFQAEAITEGQLNLLNGLVREMQSKPAATKRLLSQKYWNISQPTWAWKIFGSRDKNDEHTFEIRFADIVGSINSSAASNVGHQNAAVNPTITGLPKQGPQQLPVSCATSTTANNRNTGTPNSDLNAASSAINRNEAPGTPVIANTHSIRPQKNQRRSITPNSQQLRDVQATPRTGSSSTSTPGSYRAAERWECMRSNISKKPNLQPAAVSSPASTSPPTIQPKRMLRVLNLETRLRKIRDTFNVADFKVFLAGSAECRALMNKMDVALENQGNKYLHSVIASFTKKWNKQKNSTIDTQSSMGFMKQSKHVSKLE